MEERQMPRQHRMIITNRSSGVLNGIVDILSFDVNEIILETDQGMLMIKGRELHVNRLTLEKGEVDVTGHIDALLYSDMPKKETQKESRWGRLWK